MPSLLTHCPITRQIQFEFHTFNAPLFLFLILLAFRGYINIKCTGSLFSIRSRRVIEEAAAASSSSSSKQQAASSKQQQQQQQNASGFHFPHRHADAALAVSLAHHFVPFVAPWHY